MKITVTVLMALAPLAAQEIKIPPSLDRLASKATEVVDVTLDASMLQLASRFLSDNDKDDVKVKKLVGGLKGVYVRSFEFDKTGEYLDSDVEAIRSQVRSPGWTRVVGVYNKKGGDNAEVFLKTEGGQITGLTIISAEPKQLTVVHIAGSINPDQLSELGGRFGIPKLDKAAPKPKPSGKDE